MAGVLGQHKHSFCSLHLHLVQEEVHKKRLVCAGLTYSTDFLVSFEDRPYCRVCVEIEKARQKRKAEERAATKNPSGA